MARKKLTMRQIHEILRLKHQNRLSVRKIARSCGLPTSTVGDYLQRAEIAGISWPHSEDLSEQQLVERLMATAPPKGEPCQVLPDWTHIHTELGRKSVTLQLLWQEYRAAQPEGYGYSRFCELYQRWAGTLDPVLRQVHLPGEKMFVDWAGQTVAIHNAQDGTLSYAHLFVAVLGASNKTYVEAFEDEKLASWIGAHCHAYAFFRGVARVTVPDNLKTGVVRPCRYEPVIHQSYQEMAQHFGTVVVPARAKKPRDKAKVETGVQIAERQILAALRDQRFFSVGELNQAIIPLLAHFTPPQNEESPYSMGLKACFGISSSWLRLLALQETENLFLIFLRFGHLIEFDTTDPHALSPQRLESFHHIAKRPLAILALSILGEERL